MTPNTLQDLANLAQVISFPVTCLALVLQITSWLIPNPLAFKYSSLLQKTRSVLPYIIVSGSSFWLGSTQVSIINWSNYNFWISIALIIILIITIISASRFNLNPPNSMIRVKRQALIDTGIRLMLATKTEVIMFGSDMSWANDYEEAIQRITSQGKKVTVLYASSQATESGETQRF